MHLTHQATAEANNLTAVAGAKDMYSKSMEQARTLPFLFKVNINQSNRNKGCQSLEITGFHCEGGQHRSC